MLMELEVKPACQQHSSASVLRLNTSSKPWLVNVDTKDVLKWELHITWPYQVSLYWRSSDINMQSQEQDLKHNYKTFVKHSKKLEYFQNHVFGEKVKSPWIGPHAHRRPTVRCGSAWSCWLDRLRPGCCFKLKCMSTTMTSVDSGYKKPEYDKII